MVDVKDYKNSDNIHPHPFAGGGISHFLLQEELFATLHCTDVFHIYFIFLQR